MKLTPEGFAVLENDTHISRWVEQAKRLDFDQNIMPTLLPLIKTGDVVVDVGAFIGDHTYAYLKAVGPTGIVYAFEPNPAAYTCLQLNCPDAIMFMCGLSDAQEVVSLAPSDNAGASYLTRGSGSISCAPLDDFLLTRLDFLKIDVEGYECHVLRGARRTIAMCRPIMYIEVAEEHLVRAGACRERLFGILEGMGYGWEGMWGITDFTLPQFDIICRPK